MTTGAGETTEGPRGTEGAGAPAWLSMELSDPEAAGGDAGEVARYAAGHSPGDLGTDGIPPGLLALVDSEDEDEAETALASTTMALLCGVAWRAGRRRLLLSPADVADMGLALRFELALVHLQRDGIIDGYQSVDTSDRTSLGAALRLWLESLSEDGGAAAR